MPTDVDGHETECVRHRRWHPVLQQIEFRRDFDSLHRITRRQQDCRLRKGLHSGICCVFADEREEFILDGTRGWKSAQKAECQTGMHSPCCLHVPAPVQHGTGRSHICMRYRTDPHLNAPVKNCRVLGEASPGVSRSLCCRDGSADLCAGHSCSDSMYSSAIQRPTVPLTWKSVVCLNYSSAANAPAFLCRSTEAMIPIACLDTCECLHCHNLFFALDARLLSVPRLGILKPDSTRCSLLVVR